MTELSEVYFKLAKLSGRYSAKGAIPVAEIKALVPGLQS